MTTPFSFADLLALATRVQETIRYAMEAAFGLGLALVILRAEDREVPLTDAIRPVFEKAYAKVVVPVLEDLYRYDDDEDDLAQFIVGGLLNDAIEGNRDYMMQRVDQLIEESQSRVKNQQLRDAAPNN